MSDLTEVEQANARFYQAFETLDLAQMDLVWSHDEHVKCVHPGWPILIGWDAVRSSWEAIFENTAEMRFTLSDVRSAANGGLAWVTCTENILSVGPAPEDSDELGPLVGQLVVATNVVRRTSDGWKLWSHHASPVLAESGEEETDDSPS